MLVYFKALRTRPRNFFFTYLRYEFTRDYFFAFQAYIPYTTYSVWTKSWRDAKSSARIIHMRLFE